MSDETDEPKARRCFTCNGFHDEPWKAYNHPFYSQEPDEPKVLEGVDVSYSAPETVSAPIRKVWNLTLLRDFIAGFSGSFYVTAASEGNPDDCVRPRTYKLTVTFHDIEEKERVAEVFVHRDGNA